MTRVEDLVVLKYSSNNCYTEVIPLSELEDNGFLFDEEKMTWSYYDCKDVALGKIRPSVGPYPSNAKGGIIGVYDRTQISHINLISSHTREATRTLLHGWALED